MIEGNLSSPKEKEEISINIISLNQTQLAKRLGYSTHTQVGKKFKQLSKEEFIKWSKEKDPNNNGWYKINGKYEIVA